MEKPLLTPTQVLQEKRGARMRRGSRNRLLLCMSCALVFTVVTFAVVFGLGFVRGDSMAPTYHDNDLVLFLRHAKFGHGDVVILRPDNSQTLEYVKRVIGVPGDTVDIDAQGRILLNGKVLSEPYASGLTQEGYGLSFPVTMAGDEYFVLGDNRENSSDSRSFGTVSQGRITGRVIALVRTGL